MKNRQELLGHCPKAMCHINVWVWCQVSKGEGFNESYNLNLRLTSWNIGSLTGKYVELIKVMTRRNIKILSFQETKWNGERSKPIGEGLQIMTYR